MRENRALLGRKLLNRLSSIFLIALMVGLVALVGIRLFGDDGLVWVGVFALGLILLSPRFSPDAVLAANGARRIHPAEAPDLVNMTDTLAARAHLPTAPRLYYLPTATVNAVTLGSGSNAAIAVTRGLLETLNRRELVGVLAHEIGHIRNGDLRILTFAETVRRVTIWLSQVGQLLLLFSLPLLMFSSQTIPLGFIATLIFAPTLSGLLQLALSRTREFRADEAAVELTRDAAGLASALRRIDLRERRLWDYFMPAGRRNRGDLFRSHPNTDERIRRLMALEDTGRHRWLPRRPELHASSIR
jgi:heat shock protein HtpX